MFVEDIHAEHVFGYMLTISINYFDQSDECQLLKTKFYNEDDLRASGITAPMFNNCFARTIEEFKSDATLKYPQSSYDHLIWNYTVDHFYELLHFNNFWLTYNYYIAAHHPSDHQRNELIAYIEEWISKIKLELETFEDDTILVDLDYAQFDSRIHAAKKSIDQTKQIVNQMYLKVKNDLSIIFMREYKK